MEGNKDEAARCLAISRKHLEAGNFLSARKFCLKSISLFESDDAKALLRSIDLAESSSSPDPEKPSASSSATEQHASSSGAKQRHTKPNGSTSGTSSGLGGDKREYTPAQHATVKRVRACRVTEYYEILDIHKDCGESEIKKAYRKLALALHPDKNGAPGADEAFKMVSKAFQILSDSQKRAIFDQSGADPEDRTGGMSAGGAGFANGNMFRGAGGPAFAFEGELSPEDLFNMFFGGGTPVGRGNGMYASFGGPGAGFRFMSPGQAPRQQGQAAEPRSLFLQILPILILFGFSLLSALPNLFSTPPVPDPRYSWGKSTRYNVERETNGLGIKYHINGNEFMNHPTIGPELHKAGIDVRTTTKSNHERGPALSKFEAAVERVYTQDIYHQCQRGLDQKERAQEMEVGWFGLGTDWDKVKRLKEEIIPACEELKRIQAR